MTDAEIWLTYDSVLSVYDPTGINVGQSTPSIYSSNGIVTIPSLATSNMISFPGSTRFGYSSNTSNVALSSSIASNFVMSNMNLGMNLGKTINLASGTGSGCTIGFGQGLGSSNLDIVGYQSASAGSVRKVKVWDNLEVQSDLTVGGTLTLNTGLISSNAITGTAVVASTWMKSGAGFVGPIFPIVNNPGVTIPAQNYLGLNQDYAGTNTTYNWTPSTSNAICQTISGTPSTYILPFAHGGFFYSNVNNVDDMVAQSCWAYFRFFILGCQQQNAETTYVLSNAFTMTPFMTPFQVGIGFHSYSSPVVLPRYDGGGSNFYCLDYGYWRGPTFNVSPWYYLNPAYTGTPCIYLKNVATAPFTYRASQVHIQFCSSPPNFV